MKLTKNQTNLLVLTIIAYSCVFLGLALAQTTTQTSLSPSTSTDTKQTETTTIASSATTTTTITTTTASPARTTSIETEESEPITSTTDSLSVNSDETSTETVEPSAEDGEGEPSGEGLEAKSISSSSGANKIDNNNEGRNAKLSIATDIDGELPAKSVQGQATGPAINLTEIDEIYVEGRKDEEQIVENWHKLSKKFKKGLGNIIGAMVPYALNMSQEAKISSNCSGAMLKWILSMNQLKSWALKMLDASGKPIAGLLEGSMTMFGNYRQCLKIRAPDDDEIEFSGGEFREYFRGKYCIIQAKPWLPQKDRFYNLNAKMKSLQSEEEENQWYDKTILEELSEWLLAFNYVDIRYDLCVPSMCGREDLQRAINYLLKGVDMKARILRCESEAPNGFGMAAQVESGSQQIAEALAATADMTGKKNDTSSFPFSLQHFSQLGWIFIPMIAILLVLIATALSVGIGDGHQDDQLLLSEDKKNKLRRAISALSLKRSVNSHLNIDYDQLADDKPLALYGLRFMLVLWVILVEAAVNLKFEYLRELMMLKDLIFMWPMQLIINSTMQYDSIILLTAFTMGYKNCLNDGMNNTRALTKFVLDKFVRLMPSVMVMVALVILLPLVYRGPVWNDYVAKQSAVCQSTGWVNSIFLQNYLPFDNIVSIISIRTLGGLSNVEIIFILSFNFLI